MSTLSEDIERAVKADWGRNPWYKAGEAVFNPTLPDMRKPDAVRDYILQGWDVAEPFIDAASRVTFIGSCFGSAAIEHLKGLDYGAPGTTPDALFIPINETLSTTFAMRQLFEWALEGTKPDAALLKGNRAIDINYSDDLWQSQLDRIRNTDVFVIMISSAEIWQDRPTGAVLWRETPGVNLERQVFRTSTAEENRLNLLAVHQMLRRRRPDAKLICALSPIPMIATYREVSCITANTVSKAAVRTAIDEVYREVASEGCFYYFPLYEVVLEGFGASPHGGHFNGDRRHINDTVLLDYMLPLFETKFCRVRNPSASVFQAYVKAKVDALELPPALIEMATRGDRRGLQHMINGYLRADDQPTAELVARYAAECLARPPADARDTVWASADLVWQSLPSRAWVGSAPQILAVPSMAWDYGAASAVVQAPSDADLLLRVRLRTLAGVAGVMLMRPDGSGLSDRDVKVSPEDDWVTIELCVYPADGPAHILIRNFDCDGVAGQVEVHSVDQRFSPAVAPSV